MATIKGQGQTPGAGRPPRQPAGRPALQLWEGCEKFGLASTKAEGQETMNETPDTVGTIWFRLDRPY